VLNDPGAFFANAPKFDVIGRCLGVSGPTLAPRIDVEALHLKHLAICVRSGESACRDVYFEARTLTSSANVSRSVIAFGLCSFGNIESSPSPNCHSICSSPSPWNQTSRIGGPPSSRCRRTGCRSQFEYLAVTDRRLSRLMRRSPLHVLDCSISKAKLLRCKIARFELLASSLLQGATRQPRNVRVLMHVVPNRSSSYERLWVSVRNAASRAVPMKSRFL
jgi:hypothetical protein